MPSVQELTQLPLENAVANAGEQTLTQYPLEFAYLHNADLAAAQELTQYPLEFATDDAGQQTVTQFLLEFAYVPAGAVRLGFALSVSKSNV